MYAIKSQNRSPFSPLDFPGLLCWLDCSDPSATGISPADNTTLTTWSDKSGNGNHFTASGTATFHATGTKGVSVAGSFFSRTSFAGLVTGSAPSMSVYIASVTTDVSAQRTLFSYGTTGTPNTVVFVATTSRPGYSGLNFTTQSYQVVSLNSALIISDVISSNVPTVGSAIRNFSMNLGSNNLGTGNDRSAAVGSISSGSVYFGARFDGTLPYTGRLYGLLYYRGAHTGIQRQCIETFLRTKYSLYDSAFTISNSVVAQHAFPLLSPIPMRRVHPLLLQTSQGINFGHDPSLVFWVDASDSKTITLNASSKVTQWRDKSGNNNHVIPIGIYGNASVSTAFQNGLNVLNFTGNNIYRGGTAVYPYEAFVVVALKSLVRTDVMGIGSTTADNFNSLTFGEYTSLRWHNGSSGFSRTPNTVAPANETSTNFLLMSWSLANSNFILRRNGTVLSSTASYTFTMSADSAFQFGIRQTVSTAPDIQCNMYLAEVLVFNRQLMDSSRQQLEHYLAYKWGLQNSLVWPNATPTLTLSRTPVLTGSQFVSLWDHTQNSLVSLVYWFDASDASTVTVTSGAVSAWADKAQYTASAATLIQNTVGSRPTYSNNGVVFSGSQFLVSSLNVTTFLGTTMTYKAMILVFSNAAGQSATFTNNTFVHVGTTTGVIFGLQMPTTGSILDAVISGTSIRSTSQGYTAPGLAIVSLLQNGTTGTFSVNGNTILTASVGSSTLTTSHFLYMCRGLNSAFTRGTVHELLMFRGDGMITLSKLRMIEGYLATKWNRLSYLSSTHPFAASVSN